MRKSMQIPNRPSVHIVEHFAGNYWGSASFLLDLAAQLSSPENIILISHRDISGAEFSDQMKERWKSLGKLPETIGRVTYVTEDGIEEAANKHEMGLLPGMEMIILVNGSALSGALKYVYNTALEQSRWVSIVCSVQCGFKKTFVDVLSRECEIGSCLCTGYLDTYVYEENKQPYNICNGEKVDLCRNSMSVSITSNKPVVSMHIFHTNEVVDTLST